MIRNWAKYQSAILLSGANIHSLIGRISRGRSVPPVIGYHRVVEDFSLSAQTFIPSLLISTATLVTHLDWLGRRYEFVSLDEIGSIVESGSTRARPAVALSFDDGYRDFYELAFPILQRKGIPSALFVVSGLPDTAVLQAHDLLYLLLTRRSQDSPLPRSVEGVPIPSVDGLNAFNATRKSIEALPSFALQRLIEILSLRDPQAAHLLHESRAVDWDMITRMHHAGVTIGSHTRTHVLLPNETQFVAQDEATGSRLDLESRLNSPIQHFAYPSGAYDDIAVETAAAAGYKYAFTTCGHQDPRYPLLTIPRTLLWERSCLDSSGEFCGPVLECLIEGAFDPISGCRQSHRRARALRTAA